MSTSARIRISMKGQGDKVTCLAELYSRSTGCWSSVPRPWNMPVRPRSRAIEVWGRELLIPLPSYSNRFCVSSCTRSETVRRNLVRCCSMMNLSISDSTGEGYLPV